MQTIAKNYDEFLQKISEATRTALNTDAGQEMTEKLLQQQLLKNPDLTAEEWQQIKSEFLTFCVLSFVRETPEAMQEMGLHVYNELRGREESKNE